MIFGAEAKPRSVLALLSDRERGSSPALDMKILRWAASSWLEKPIHSSSYCKLNPEAKSTIALAFSTDGVLFASTHGDHTVKIFRCATWLLCCTLRGHRRTPWTIKFHPCDRHILASGSLDESVRIWDLRTEQCIRVLEFDFVVSCLAFHSSGELLAVTSGRRIFLCRWGRSNSSGASNVATMGTSVIPNPSPISSPPAIPGILERLAGWGSSTGSSAAATGVAALNTGDAVSATASGGDRGASVDGYAEAPNKVVILSGDNPQRCVAFKASGSAKRTNPPPTPL